jgi:hypothetical protein
MISAEVIGRPPAPTIDLVFLMRKPSARFRRLVTAIFFAPPPATAVVGVTTVRPPVAIDGRVPARVDDRHAEKKIS